MANQTLDEMWSAIQAANERDAGEPYTPNELDILTRIAIEKQRHRKNMRILHEMLKRIRQEAGVSVEDTGATEITETIEIDLLDSEIEELFEF